MQPRNSTRVRFKGPEGRWLLHMDKGPALSTFSFQRGTRLTLANLQGGPEEGIWLIYNVGVCTLLLAKVHAVCLGLGSASRLHFLAVDAFA